MMHEVEAVILAGGYGKRMRELTANRQKCMFVVDGKPILAHILDNLQIAFGSVKVIILTGFKGGEVKIFFGSKLGNIQIEYTSDSGLLGTRKAILQARDQIKGPFFVIGGDVIAHPHQYERMVNDYHPDLFGVTSAATDHRPAPTHAVIYTDSSNKIFKIQLFPNIPDDSKGGLRDMTLHYFNNNMLNIFSEAPGDEENISPVIQKEIERGGFFLAAKYSFRWYHFVDPSDLNTSIVFTDS